MLMVLLNITGIYKISSLLRHVSHIIIILSLLIPTLGIAQDKTTERLALQYYQQAEYEKAAELYHQLFNAKPNGYYYTYYLNCLIETGEFRVAEKFVKSQKRNQALRKNFTVELGYIYLKEGNAEKAHKEFEKAIDRLKPNRQDVVTLANAFLLRRQTEYAVRTYLQGRKEVKDYKFHMELANVYQVERNYVLMLEEYFDLLLVEELYLQTVQARLQNLLTVTTDETLGEQIKDKLIDRVQKYPDNPIYSEMLLWYSLQIKDFHLALIQAKALDVRISDEGESIFQVGQLAASNGSYDVAIDAFNYIIGKGREHYLFLSAEIHLLQAKYDKLTSRGHFTKEELTLLESEYLSVLNQLGRNASTIILMKNMAHMQAFFLDKGQDAIEVLEYTLKIPNAKAEHIAACKIELADIMLMNGEVWESTLLYSQVEKAFKHDPIGHLAKFKNAKLSFYIGEFDWANTQLDILRAATSKLIANDAMELSLLITDNTGLDSSTVALGVFARADLMLFMRKEKRALELLDSLEMAFPGHRLQDEVLFKKAMIRKGQGNYLAADSLLAQVLDLYGYDILADNALIERARIYDYIFDDQKTAQIYYEKIVLEHPGSLFIIEARKRYRELRGDYTN